MFGQQRLVPEESTEEGNADLRKRVKYLCRCKEVLWNWWSGEYLKPLRQRHIMKQKFKQITFKPGDVVLIQEAERNRGKGNMGMVVKPFQGRDEVVRAVRLRAEKSYREQAVQHLFPLELSCEKSSKCEKTHP